MKNRTITRYLFVLNAFVAVFMICATIARKGWVDGLLAALICTWLAAGPLAYMKDWTIPLFGPFSYASGNRQLARFWAVCVMTLMLWLLAGNELVILVTLALSN
jgi:hypothetical protein